MHLVTQRGQIACEQLVHSVILDSVSFLLFSTFFAVISLRTVIPLPSHLHIGLVERGTVFMRIVSGHHASVLTGLFCLGMKDVNSGCITLAHQLHLLPLRVQQFFLYFLHMSFIVPINCQKWRVSYSHNANLLCRLRQNKECLEALSKVWAYCNMKGLAHKSTLKKGVQGAWECVGNNSNWQHSIQHTYLIESWFTVVQICQTFETFYNSKNLELTGESSRSNYDWHKMACWKWTVQGSY